jgi:hypothetical protein
MPHINDVEEAIVSKGRAPEEPKNKTAEEVKEEKKEQPEPYAPPHQGGMNII